MTMTQVMQQASKKLPSVFFIHQRLDTFSSNVFVVFSVKIVSTAIGMATGILVARALGPAGKGSFTLITTFPALVFCLVHLGIADANVYFLRRGTHQVSADIIRGNTLFFTGLISAFTVLVLLVLKRYICATFLSGLSEGYFYIILILIPFFIFETFGNSILVAFEKFKLLSAIDFFLRIFDTVTILLVLFVFKLGLVGVVLSFVSLFIIKCMAYFFYGFWNQPVRRPDPKSMYSSITFGLKSHAQSLTGVLHYKVDIYILAIFLSTTEIGYYSVAVALVSMIFFIPDAIGHVMYPKVAGLKESEAHQFTAQACRNTIFITMLPAVVILIFGRLLIQLLYGQEFLPACNALYLLMPGTMTMCIYKILTRNFTSRNRQQMTVFAGLLGLATNIGLNFLLIPRIGIEGASLATTISYSLTSFLLLFFFLRESGVSFRDSLVVKGSDVAAILDVIQDAVFPQKVKDRA